MPAHPQAAAIPDEQRRRPRGRRPSRRRPGGWRPSPRRSVLGLTLVILTAAALLPWGPSLARAQYFGQNKVPQHDRRWRVLESEHFAVYFYPEEREAALEALPLAERAYRRLSRILDHEFKERIPLLLYSSQSEFRETRAASGLISEGTLGMTEFLKRRVIVPFTGSYADLDHTLSHELVHAFQVDILTGPLLGSTVSAMAWQPPLWVFEGMAEYLSTPGVDEHTAMWVRAGVIDGSLISIEELSRVQDIRVYRYGQSLMAYIGRTYGDETVGAWFRAMTRRRSLEEATQDVLGVTLERLSRDWNDSLRRTYLPDMLARGHTEDVARRLTDHEKGLGAMYIAPAVSPDGGEMVYISDESPYTDLYLASALDGSRPRRLIRGERNESFETFRYLFTSLDWSPDGDRIVLVSKRDGHEQLFVFNVRSRKIERSLGFGFDEMIYPAWSPDGQQLVFTGMRQARSDLYVVGVDGEGLRALTDDRWAAFQPAWSPDGTRIAFLTDHGYSTASGSGASPWKIALIDLATGEQTLLPNQYGKNINPQWFPDGRHLLYISDRTGGIPNFFIRDLETGADYQITDLASGVSAVTPTGAAASLSDNGHRVVFAVFEENGWNLYAIRDPLALIEGRAPWMPPPPPIAAQTETAPAAEAAADTVLGATRASSDTLGAVAEAAAAAADTLVAGIPAPADSLPVQAAQLPSDSLGITVAVDTLRAEGPAIPAPEHALEEIDLAEVYAATAALPDSVDFDERPYKSRLSIDYAAAGGLYASGYGLQAQSALVFSDMLGDKNLYVGVDVNGSLEDGNYVVGYANLGTRPAFGVQAYQYWTGYGYDYSTGYVADYEQRLLRGAGIAWYQPYSRFRRVELSLDLIQERRYSYRYLGTSYWNPLEYVWEEKVSEDYYLRPEAAWVFDSAVWGPTGPLSGRRTRVGTYADVGQRTAYGATLDHRLYFNLRQRYALAVRGVVAGEWGPDRSAIAYGGPYSLRGYTDRPLAGQEVAFANLEFRFPFIEGLYIAFPGPLLFGGIRGALFFDVGTAWDNEGLIDAAACSDEGCTLDGPRGSVGFRASVNLGIAIVRWDLVRRTDFDGWDGKAFGEVSIGWEF